MIMIERERLLKEKEDRLYELESMRGELRGDRELLR
jgi:hypothetical protein